MPRPRSRGVTRRQPEPAAPRLLRFPGAVRRDPAIAAWMRGHPGALGTLARRWFSVMRSCGPDVRELLHDGHPTACVGDAALGYVNCFRAHAAVGFFRGAALADPDRLLEGTGKFMRHVKLRPGDPVDALALRRLVETAYADLQRCLGAGSRPPAERTTRTPARPTTIAEYIEAAPRAGQPHLRRLHAILRGVAPAAQATIKWGTPFFVEPRFLFAFAAHKAHCSFAPTAEVLEAFRKDLDGYHTTTNTLQIPYREPVPETLIRRMARYRLRNLGDGEGFW